jgi:hypothetical protein
MNGAAGAKEIILARGENHWEKIHQQDASTPPLYFQLLYISTGMQCSWQMMTLKDQLSSPAS